MKMRDEEDEEDDDEDEDEEEDETGEGEETPRRKKKKKTSSGKLSRGVVMKARLDTIDLMNHTTVRSVLSASR